MEPRAPLSLGSAPNAVLDVGHLPQNQRPSRSAGQNENCWNALLTEAIPVLPITGADIMEEFGLAPGPDVGKLLKRAKGINDAAPCSRAELLAKLKTTGVG